MHFPFMKLPPEIRNIIYRLTLLNEDVIGVNNKLLYQGSIGKTCFRKHTYFVYDSSPEDLGFGILALNREIRAEVIPIFYGSNRFDFVNEFSVFSFLDDHTQLSKSYMKYITIRARLQKPHHRRQLRSLKSSFQYLEQHLELKSLVYIIEE